MPSVTTESGQAARRDLIAMFERAQELAGTERARARSYRAAITQAISTSRVQERGDEVDIQMPRESWQALQDSVTDQP